MRDRYKLGVLCFLQESRQLLSRKFTVDTVFHFAQATYRLVHNGHVQLVSHAVAVGGEPVPEFVFQALLDGNQGAAKVQQLML